MTENFFYRNRMHLRSIVFEKFESSIEMSGEKNVAIA